MSINTGLHEIGVGSIWASVRRSLAPLMVCTLLAGVVTFSVLTLAAKRYEAETLLTMAAATRQPSVSASGKVGTAAARAQRLDQGALSRHLRALTASDLLIGVGNTLKLGERAEFNAAIGPIDMIDQLMGWVGLTGNRGGEAVESRMLAAMREKLVVSPVGKSQVISIRFTSRDRQLAADVANGIATAYRDRLGGLAKREANGSSANLSPTIEQWRREIVRIDAALNRFRAESNLSPGAAATPAQEQQFATRQSGSAAIQSALENTAKTMRDELQRLQSALADKPDVAEAARTSGVTPIMVTANEPVQTVFPKKVPYTLLAMATTMMIGLALTVMRGLIGAGGTVAQRPAVNDVASPAFRARGVDKARPREAAPFVEAAGAWNPSVSESIAPVATGSFSSMSVYARHLIDQLPAEGGYRLLVTGTSDAVDPSDEVVDLVAELSDAGLSVLLVDWSLDGQRLHSDIEIGAAASLAEVMTGRAEFDDVLVTLPDSNVHYIYSTAVTERDEPLDEDDINLVLDALDEAYDHVVVTGSFSDTRALFETIQGRFDAGMTIAEATTGVPPVNSDSFLGFDVADIEIVQFVRTVRPSRAPIQRAEAGRSNVDSRS